jgi:hypothetical protein
MLNWLRSWFSPTPAWLAPLGERREPFVTALRAALAARGLTLDAAAGKALLPDGGLGFANLARECASSDPMEWPTRIDGWLNAALAPSADTSSLDACKPQLRMKMFVDPPPGFLAGVNGELFGSLFAVLCVDTPTAIVSVPIDDVRSWGVEYASLRRTALDNFAANDHVERTDVDVGGVTIDQCLGEAYCVCGSALDLTPTGLGLLVSIPSRHHLLTHAVTGTESLQAFAPMASFAMELVRAAPGALTAHIVWLRPDASPVHIHVGQKRDGGPMIVVPPELEALFGG